jgi:hypothetical protein
MPYRVASPPPPDDSDDRRAAVEDELRRAVSRAARLLQSLGLVSILLVPDGLARLIPTSVRDTVLALWLAMLVGWIASLYERWWIGRDLRRLAQSR